MTDSMVGLIPLYWNDPTSNPPKLLHAETLGGNN